MNQDDLPPRPYESDDGFSAALGQTAGWFAYAATIAAAGGLLFYAILRILR